MPEALDDLRKVSEILVEFTGACPSEQAYHAMEHIGWLRRELSISQYNERAALKVAEVNAREVEGLKELLRRGGFYGEEARQASGP